MQFLLSCNYLNEGCEGGWPILNGYLAENGYLVSEECSPYLAETGGSQCANYKACPPISTVKSSYFMNGGFGQFTRVQQIQKEILRNGPVISNMKAPRYFKFYKLGILKNDETNILIENKLLSIMEDNIPT